MASQTIQDVIDIAREHLKDEISEEYRYSDNSLIRGFNVCLTAIWNLRPEVFPPSKEFVTYTTADLGKPFPIPLIFFHPVVFFVVGYAELRDDEFTDDTRATSLMNKFEADLKGLSNVRG